MELPHFVAPLRNGVPAFAGMTVLADSKVKVIADRNAPSRQREGETDAAKVRQRRWITLRNLCKSNPACIEERMRERIDELMQN
jgi:hypothetical protein